MHIALWERDGDFIVIELFFNLFNQVEMDGPVVIGFHPYTHQQVHRTVSMFTHKNFRAGITHNVAISTDDLGNNIASLVDTVLVADAKGALHAADFFGKEIADGTV